MEAEIINNTGERESELQEATELTRELLNKAYEALNELSGLRKRNKMSSYRVSGVAKELNELIKVMSCVN